MLKLIYYSVYLSVCILIFTQKNLLSEEPNASTGVPTTEAMSQEEVAPNDGTLPDSVEESASPDMRQTVDCLDPDNFNREECRQTH